MSAPLKPAGPEPTERQLECLRSILEHMGAFGYAPSIRNLGEALGIRSTNAVNDLLSALEKKRLIQRDERVSRGMRVTPEGRAWVLFHFAPDVQGSQGVR